jgi:hypothetical protein
MKKSLIFFCAVLFSASLVQGYGLDFNSLKNDIISPRFDMSDDIGQINMRMMTYDSNHFPAALNITISSSKFDVEMMLKLEKNTKLFHSDYSEIFIEHDDAGKELSRYVL